MTDELLSRSTLTAALAAILITISGVCFFAPVALLIYSTIVDRRKRQN